MVGDRKLGTKYFLVSEQLLLKVRKYRLYKFVSTALINMIKY